MKKIIKTLFIGVSLVGSTSIVATTVSCGSKKPTPPPTSMTWEQFKTAAAKESASAIVKNAVPTSAAWTKLPDTDLVFSNNQKPTFDDKTQKLTAVIESTSLKQIATFEISYAAKEVYSVKAWKCTIFPKAKDDFEQFTNKVKQQLATQQGIKNALKQVVAVSGIYETPDSENWRTHILGTGDSFTIKLDRTDKTNLTLHYIVTATFDSKSTFKIKVIEHKGIPWNLQKVKFVIEQEANPRETDIFDKWTDSAISYVNSQTAGNQKLLANAFHAQIVIDNNGAKKFPKLDKIFDNPAWGTDVKIEFNNQQSPGNKMFDNSSNLLPTFSFWWKITDTNVNANPKVLASGGTGGLSWPAKVDKFDSANIKLTIIHDAT